MKRVLCFALSCFVALSAAAIERPGTLGKIQRTGVIYLGVRDTSMPFSWFDENQQYRGYSIDLCMKIALAAQKSLGMKKLDVVLVPVISATRIAAIVAGNIDIECGDTTNNLERQAQIDFSPTIFIASNRLLTKKSSSIRNFDDLKDKAVSASLGTSNYRQLLELNRSRNLNMNVLAAKDTAEGFMMVESGRVTAYGQDDIILAAKVATSKSPQDYVISKEPLSIEPFGLGYRKNDPDFKKLVDATITQIFSSGDIKKIYAKWFESPIPPKGTNLNWKMTPELQAVIAHPTSSGDSATYAAVPEAQKVTIKKGL